VLADVDEAALNAVTVPNAKAVVCDVTKAADVARLAAEAGDIAVWVSNAGACPASLDS